MVFPAKYASQKRVTGHKGNRYIKSFYFLGLKYTVFSVLYLVRLYAVLRIRVHFMRIRNRNQSEAQSDPDPFIW
jgi:hypothetical protein